MGNKRKICVVVFSRANYGRIKTVIDEIKRSSALHLQLIVGASALLDRFGMASKTMEADGYIPDAYVTCMLEGDSPSVMAKSTGLAVIEMASHLERMQPDAVLTVADRFETMATAIAASYMNIPLIHTQGGEVTGSIDDSVRHAITKLAHMHLTATELATQNVLRMGEERQRVFQVGCPAMDVLRQANLNLEKNFFDRDMGVGKRLDMTEPYIVVVQHPVTTEHQSSGFQIIETLEAVNALKSVCSQVCWLWPNIDAGTDKISRALRIARETEASDHICFFKNFSPAEYGKLINNSKCLVGNSSSGIREASFLGIPAVNIGTRQDGRQRGPNVIDVDYNAAEILKAIKLQMQVTKYPPSFIFGDGAAAKKIVAILETETISIDKKLAY